MADCLEQGGNVTIRFMSKIESVDDKEQGEVRVKVTDRRKFDSLGKRREDAAPEMEAETDHVLSPGTDSGPTAEATGEEPLQAEQTPAGPQKEPDSAHGAGSGKEAQAAGGRGETAPGQVDFQSFVYFLYMSALHELGIPTQEGAEPRPADLERARFFVEVLQLLEGKTKGNLEPGETKLLEEALYNLRMQYVGISKNTAS